MDISLRQVGLTIVHHVASKDTDTLNVQPADGRVTKVWSASM